MSLLWQKCSNFSFAISLTPINRYYLFICLTLVLNKSILFIPTKELQARKIFRHITYCQYQLSLASALLRWKILANIALLCPNLYYKQMGKWSYLVVVSSIMIFSWSKGLRNEIYLCSVIFVRIVHYYTSRPQTSQTRSVNDIFETRPFFLIMSSFHCLYASRL